MNECRHVDVEIQRAKEIALELKTGKVVPRTKEGGFKVGDLVECLYKDPNDPTDEGIEYIGKVVKITKEFGCHVEYPNGFLDKNPPKPHAPYSEGDRSISPDKFKRLMESHLSSIDRCTKEIERVNNRIETLLPDELKSPPENFYRYDPKKLPFMFDPSNCATEHARVIIGSN